MTKFFIIILNLLTAKIGIMLKKTKFLKKINPIVASPPRRFAVRWPAPDGGPSFGWRLIFSVHFPSREKEQKTARESVNSL